MTDQVPVPIGACQCPGAPHEDGDVVYLRPKLDLYGGMEVQRVVLECVKDDAVQSLGEDAKTIAISARLRESYVRGGVAAWTLQDDDGPVPVSVTTINEHLISDFARVEDVAAKADELYAGPVVIPFVQKLRAFSASTSSNGSTSANGAGTRKPRKRSKRSSTSTTPMEGTETTSSALAGASSS